MKIGAWIRRRLAARLEAYARAIDVTDSVPGTLGGAHHELAQRLRATAAGLRART